MGSPGRETQEVNATESSSKCTPPAEAPSAPNPAADPGMVPSRTELPLDHVEDRDRDGLNVFEISPVAALKMFSNHVEMLAKLTGDIPPSPACNSTGRRHSKPEIEPSHAVPVAPGPDDVDGVRLVYKPETRLEVHCEEVTDDESGTERQARQQDALARRFFSKKAPPIAVEDYLLRLHRYCPMSTAVYLGACLYIDRLAIGERIIPVTPRNVHRLVLAGLRVAMKALEDLCYPHNRFAKVGGVSEIELARLEISFCFLMDFDLKVDAAMLWQEATMLKNNPSYRDRGTTFEPRAFSLSEKRKISPSLTHQSARKQIAVSPRSPT